MVVKMDARKAAWKAVYKHAAVVVQQFVLYLVKIHAILLVNLKITMVVAGILNLLQLNGQQLKKFNIILMPWSLIQEA